ncbi:MAG TPA: MFS transporter [Thermoleophilaceae bacterium]|jgi:EmrB/QacA subfamily drug resistance transporter
MTERRKLWILVLCCIGQFMVILDVSVVNVALPAIRSGLHFSAASLQWVVNAYTLTFAGFLLLGGRACDLLVRRNVFNFGLALFALASLVGGLAQSETMLIIARGIQGLGGALVAPATLSIITSTFTEGGERNRALGAWGAMGAIGGATGVLLGGILTELLSWRWILFVNVPIAAATGIAAMRVIGGERPAAATRKNFDVAGALSGTAGLIVLTFGIVKTEQYGWGSTRTLVTLAIASALLALFLLIETRFAKAPLMPVAIFRSRQLSAANVVVLLLGGSAFAMWYFLSLYLQEVRGFTPIETGLAFVPGTLSLAVAAQVAGKRLHRTGPGLLLALGMGAVAVGMILLGQVGVNSSYWADVLVPFMLTGAGIGVTFVSVTVAGMAGVKPAEVGLASGLINTSRQIGGSLGLAILATTATSRTSSLLGHTSVDHALTSGFQRAFVLGGIFAAVGAIASATLIPRQRPPRSAPAEGALPESAST